MTRRFAKICSSLVLLVAASSLQAASDIQPMPAAQAIRLNLLANAPKVEAAAQQKLLDWLREYQEVVYRLNIRRFLEMLDLETLGGELAGKPATQMDAAEKAKWTKTLALTMERFFPMMKEFFGFQTGEIRRIEVKGDKAVLLLRARDADGAESKMLLWLSQRGENWLLTDYEILEMNVRLSALLAMGAEAGRTKLKNAADIGRTMMQVGVASQEEDFETVLKVLKTLDAVDLPPALTTMTLLAKAQALTVLGEVDEVWTVLDRLEAVAPDQPAAHYLRAAAAFDKERYAEVVKSLGKVEALIGHNEDTWEMLTSAFMALKQPERARSEAEKWLAEYPQSSAAAFALWQSLPEGADRGTALRPHLLRLSDADGGLEQFATAAEDNDDAAALELAVAVMKANKHEKDIVAQWQKALDDLRQPALKKKFTLPPPPGARE